MQSLLSQLNSVPGVVGSMVCDTNGRLLAQAFPPVFDPSMLRGAAAVLADSTVGLETVTGKVGMVDLRYGDARIVVKPMTGAHLLLLCTLRMNLQVLNISTSVAVPKLEQLVAARPAQRPATAAALAKPAPENKAANSCSAQLHETVQRINAAIQRKKLDPFKIRGQIAMKAGFALDLIDADTPDDPAKLQKLKAAASAVLGEPV